uniref:Type-4 uracil-DNA glycosylase n=1 Tax=viral metagenome TaxID=1070528 RepID=A0A6M3KXJ2_9ZZZZ
MDSLEQIDSEIKICQRCELRAGCTQPVPGIGNIGAKYFLLGEAPGREEDVAGLPFIGSAGRKLDKLLALADIDINNCYLSNVCRCRPPKNRDPRKKEIKACVEFLWREIRLVKPQYIIALGATPLGLFTTSGVRQTHGTMMDINVEGATYKLISQYHPAACLHQPRLWAEMLGDWENLPEKVPHDFTILPESALDSTSVPIMALDTETDGHGGLGQWSVAFRYSGQIYVIPFYGKRKGMSFSNPLVFHNAKYDIRELKANGIEVKGPIHDTMILAYCMGLGKQAPKDDSKARAGSNMVGGLGLKYLARRHLGMQMMKWDDVKENPESVPEYNAMDSVGTLLLAEKWMPQVGQFYYNIDMPLLPVLMAMEDRGVQIDPNFLATFAKDLDNRLANFDLPLNPHATQDVQSYVYGTLGVEPWKFTETGAPSVESEVLETINDPVVKQILEYKELYKDRGTYVENYVKMRDIEDRVHPEYKQTSTSTSRLSCARPNLQNVDKDGDMRKLIVAKEGHKLVRFDFDQLEFRTLACITLDPVLLSALAQNKKIHTVTAERMGVKYRDAKTVNFGVMFGQEAWSLSQQLRISIGEARNFLDYYFATFPGIKRYRDQQTERIKAEKKATIPWTGRTRRIDAMYVESWRIQQEGIKEGINLPVQGTAAEVVKTVMIELHRLGAPMVLQVHDELLLEVPKKDAVEYSQWLKEYVPTIVTINDVQFPIDVSIGDNWYEVSK